MEHEEDTKALGIKGVYQLQGGIDKYFRDFPEGGWWRGKNYVFDKRFAHAPPVIETFEREAKKKEKGETDAAVEIPVEAQQQMQAMGRCEACQKPWDKLYNNCGEPSMLKRLGYDHEEIKIDWPDSECCGINGNEYDPKCPEKGTQSQLEWHQDRN